MKKVLGLLFVFCLFWTIIEITKLRLPDSQRRSDAMELESFVSGSVLMLYLTMVWPIPQSRRPKSIRTWLFTTQGINSKTGDLVTSGGTVTTDMIGDELQHGVISLAVRLERENSGIELSVAHTCIMSLTDVTGDK